VRVVHGLEVAGKTDTVGAGDAVVAAVAAALGSGQDAVTAANLANVAAMVTVRKVRQTGTASCAEILEAGRDLNYIFEPELADSPGHAKKIPGTDIEIVGELPGDLAIRHCIFDHDGTLSSLREGWETIMESIMIQAVLGTQRNTAGRGVYDQVQKMVRDLIDRTTGAPTLVQMAALEKLVREARFVPESEILDGYGYKRIFNERLLELVWARRKKLASGELNSSKFQIRNATRLLEALHDRGVKLYLASGTDVADVAAEAEALGYAHLFEGEIFGATGDSSVDAKKVVLDRVIAGHGLTGRQFATFGDGPVEMRETRKRGGLCIGVASDESRGFGWNMSKRRRLIRAGATVLVPDFSELPALMKVLQLA